MNTRLDERFEDFLESHMSEYETAETALFSIVRTAFIAGWNAAGGTPRYEEDPSGAARLLSEIRSREDKKE